MAEADTLQLQLLGAQNSDGGWGYQNGSSWTEPTALALLALGATAGPGAARLAAHTWLLGSQKPDGGWAPQPSVNQSTWVTSLATLALAGTDSTREQHRRGVSWLLKQILPQEPPVPRFIARLQGIHPDPRPAGGSPWFPGTAAWIGPTAMSILALSNQAAANHDHQLRACVSESQQFILSRRCGDGGWNHGGAKYQSQNASSYPEMTGMALLALRGADPAELRFPIERAVDFVRSPTSSEALSWLQLGLLAHGRDCRSAKAELPCRTTRDISLRLLAIAGASSANKLVMT
jgi:hypothetical protein